MITSPARHVAERPSLWHRWFRCRPSRGLARRGDFSRCSCGRPYIVTQIGRGPFARLAWTPADR